MPGCLVVGGDVLANRSLHAPDGTKCSPANPLASDFSELTANFVEPVSAGSHEVNRVARETGDSRFHIGVLVRCVVVEN